MEVRSKFSRALTLCAMAVTVLTALLSLGAVRAVAQQFGTAASPFEFATPVLAAGQAARLNVVNTSARDQAPLSMTLAFDIYTRSSSTSGDSTGDPDAGLDGYRFRRRVSQEVTVAPGESASFDYTNSAAESAQVRAVLEVAGIDTSPGGEVAGIDTSPVIVTFELHERGRPVTVVARKVDVFGWHKCSSQVPNIKIEGFDLEWQNFCDCVYGSEKWSVLCMFDLLDWVKGNAK